jgi:hypothetical protein
MTSATGTPVATRLVDATAGGDTAELLLGFCRAYTSRPPCLVVGSELLPPDFSQVLGPQPDMDWLTELRLPRLSPTTRAQLADPAGWERRDGEQMAAKISPPDGPGRNRLVALWSAERTTRGHRAGHEELGLVAGLRVYATSLAGEAPADLVERVNRHLSLTQFLQPPASDLSSLQGFPWNRPRALAFCAIGVAALLTREVLAGTTGLSRAAVTQALRGLNAVPFEKDLFLVTRTEEWDAIDDYLGIRSPSGWADLTELHRWRGAVQEALAGPMAAT